MMDYGMSGLSRDLWGCHVTMTRDLIISALGGEVLGCKHEFDTG